MAVGLSRKLLLARWQLSLLTARSLVTRLMSSNATAAHSVSCDDSRRFDVAVVGGGIVGVATARELIMRHPNMKIAVVEKEERLAKHQSGHNSGVIHSGIYYEPGSLRAKLCVKGVQMTYDYCDKKSLPYKRNGKVIVAVSDEEMPRLKALYERGMQNGVKDLRMVGPEELREIEPYCQGKMAIHSPNTGIIDYAALTLSFAEDFKEAGGHVFTGFEVNRFTTHSRQGAEGVSVGIHAAKKPFLLANHVICCTGLHADRVSQLSGASSTPRIVPFRGEFLILKPEKTHLVRGNIYPVPDPRFPFLGFHFTPRMDGSVWLGPNAILAFAREGYRMTDFNFKDLSEALQYSGLRKLLLKYWQFGAVEVFRGSVIAAQVKKLQMYVPELRLCDVSRGPAGVRALALAPDGKLVDDFVFDQGTGVMSSLMLHVRNAPSPAATASMAIAEMVADKAAETFSWRQYSE